MHEYFQSSSNIICEYGQTPFLTEYALQIKKPTKKYKVICYVFILLVLKYWPLDLLVCSWVVCYTPQLGLGIVVVVHCL